MKNDTELSRLFGILAFWLLLWNILAVGIEYVFPGFVVNWIQTKWLAALFVVSAVLYGLQLLDKKTARDR